MQPKEKLCNEIKIETEGNKQYPNDINSQEQGPERQNEHGIRILKIQISDGVK